MNASTHITGDYVRPGTGPSFSARVRSGSSVRARACVDRSPSHYHLKYLIVVFGRLQCLFNYWFLGWTWTGVRSRIRPGGSEERSLATVLRGGDAMFVLGPVKNSHSAAARSDCEFEWVMRGVAF